jgi:hypothetical protein
VDPASQAGCSRLEPLIERGASLVRELTASIEVLAELRGVIRGPDGSAVGDGEPVDAGKLKPVIDRRYPLRSAPDALRYVAERHGARSSSTSRD